MPSVLVQDGFRFLVDSQGRRVWPQVSFCNNGYVMSPYDKLSLTCVRFIDMALFGGLQVIRLACGEAQQHIHWRCCMHPAPI